MSRSHSIILFLICSTLSLSAQVISRYEIIPVEAAVPDDGGNVWDFSRCERVGPDVCVRVENFGDSMLTVSTPSVRCCYRIEGDTLRRLSSENRFYQLVDASAPVVATPLRKESSESESQSSGMAFHADSLAAHSIISLYPDRAGIFISNDRDTIPGVVLRRSSERMTGVYGKSQKAFTQWKDSYTWVYPSLSFPLARTEVIRDSVGSREVSHAVNTWVLAEGERGENISRPEPQKVAKAPLNSLKNNLQEELIALYTDASTRHTGGLGQMVMAASVIQNGAQISVTFPAKSEITPISNDGPITILLTDILGRVRVSATHSTDSSSINISTATLSTGEYLLYVSTDSDSAVKKIILH